MSGSGFVRIVHAIASTFPPRLLNLEIAPSFLSLVVTLGHIFFDFFIGKKVQMTFWWVDVRIALGSP